LTTLVFDCETNGLLPELDRLHSLVIKDVETGEVTSCHLAPLGTYKSIKWGLVKLAKADVIVGHNIIGFDIPAIQKVYPWWKPKGVARDTIVLSRLLWPKEQITDIDFSRLRKDPKCIPPKLVGAYSLEAWGYRLGEYKGDYKGPWDKWSPEMQAYCEQDVEVTTKLWALCQQRLSEDWGPECVELEHEVATIIARQMAHGFAFDVQGAATLYAKLAARRTELAEQLQKVFPPRIIETVSKATNKKFGYVKGQVRRKVIPFNPSSRKQVAQRLQALGWKPKEFTADGTPSVNDDILTTLPHPSAKVLAEYYLVEKRLGALAEGKEAWLKLERKGRIHGFVNSNGAVTGRMTHSRPNGANVPGVRAPYGKECRSLFRATPGRTLVGCDADALELRCLANRMARYDGGAYIDTVLKGDKSKGTDMHSVNAKALGGIDREVAKTWFYAFIYGAGDHKLGYTLLGKGPKGKLIAAGKAKRASFLAGLPAMAQLVRAVQRTIKQRPWLKGLDGRKVFIRSEHAALNTLLQSDGALLMKRALVILDKNLQAKGLVPGKDYEFVANVHDEWQIEVDPAHAETIGKEAADAIRLAGEHWQLACPLAGNYVIGETWADTH
jgi:DNA polymerase-1